MVQFVEPEVFLVSKPEIDYDELEKYLESVGGESWLHSREGTDYAFGGRVYVQPPIDSHNLVEVAGRLCYRSWKPGLNPNVERIRENQAEYLLNILMSGHGSVLEHANFTFLFKNVSRVFTHELVRHRAGSAFSQESFRYVRLEEIPFVMPDWVHEDEDLKSLVTEYLIRAEEFQMLLAQYGGLDEDGVGFHKKKEFTSFMRRFAPEGVATSIMWTGNLRTLRNVIEQRTALGAEEEIRRVFNKVGFIMEMEVPLLFSDFDVEDGVWTPTYRKV